MKGKIIQIVDNFDPDKKYNVHITKQISKALSKLQVGKEYKLQDLIKNNAKWWSEGQISDEEFTKAIEYLVKEGIIKI